MIGVSVEDTLAKISDLADAAEPVAYPEEFNIDTDESSESEEVETVETLASADGTGDGDAGDAGVAGDGDPADPETEVKVGTSNWRVQLLCEFFGYIKVCHLQSTRSTIIHHPFSV